VKPQWVNITALSDNLVNYWKKRGISQRVLNDMCIGEGMEFMPQVGRDAMVMKFPYFENKEVVNVKFRGQVKSKDTPPVTKRIFKMVKDAKLVFYNIDAIKTSEEALVVEGEGDCMSFIEAGYETVVSVPNGGNKGSLKLEYLDNCWQYFENKTKIYIGTDNDETGIALRNELIRRLGDERCFIIDYKDCKDSNEYLVKYGAIELAEVVRHARPVPIEGIFRAEQMKLEVDDLYAKGLPAGIRVGISGFDELASFVPGQLTMITGTPSSGKSEFLDYLCELLAIKHGWKFGIFSPENFPVSLHLSKLIEKLVGKPFGKPGDEETKRMTEEEKDKAMEFIQDHFFFIRPKDENYTLDNILAIGKKLILKHGINSLLIDPWNALEHQIPSGIQETTFINNQLAKIYSFKQRHDIHFFLVAHPVKMNRDKKTGKYEIPSLYNISGSAHFYNRTDNGMTVYRDFQEKRTMVYVQKWKFKHLGKIGDVKLVYDYSCGRYSPEGMQFDRRNHLLESNPIEMEPMELIPIPDDQLPF
jgi:twinkle protein